MKKIQVLATFTGRNGSEGYVKGKLYHFEVVQKGAALYIKETSQTKPVKYSNLKALLENWHIVSISLV